MNLLIAVKSCVRDMNEGFHEAIRKTWGQNLDVEFFVGNGGLTQVDDEVRVDAPDDYMGLPLKTQGICKYFVQTGFDHVFLCDNDTIVKPDLLLDLDYQRWDYAGHFSKGQAEVKTRFTYADHHGRYYGCYPWCSGGVGYFLSRRAAKIVAETEPKVWAEDMYVGQVLGPEIEHDRLKASYLQLDGNATWHFRKSRKFPAFTPELLHRIYQDGTPQKVYEEARQR